MVPTVIRVLDKMPINKNEKGQLPEAQKEHTNVSFDQNLAHSSTTTERCRASALSRIFERIRGRR